MQQGLIVVGDAIDRVASPDFIRRLREFDPDLTVFWHKPKQRWIIEQCIEHLAPTAEHAHVCRRVYVLLVQGDNREYLGLDHADRIFEKLRLIDTRRQGYEPGPAGLEKWKQQQRDERRYEDEKREAAIRELPKQARADNWLSMNRAKLLLDRHSLKLNK